MSSAASAVSDRAGLDDHGRDPRRNRDRSRPGLAAGGPQAAERGQRAERGHRVMTASAGR